VNRSPDASPPQDPTPSGGSCVVDRRLATAGDLFYREGIHSVGIQRVIEEAGVAKASLYAHFKSKDDLVAAYLAQRSEAVRSAIVAELADIAAPVDRLLHLFDRSVAWVAADAPRLAGALMALLEGAGSRGLAERSPEAARDARWAAGQLLAAAGFRHRIARPGGESSSPSDDGVSGVRPRPQPSSGARARDVLAPEGHRC